MRHTQIKLNLSALSDNLSTLKRHAPTAKMMAMVKANAYGHGVRDCLDGLMDADAFGVATFDEGMEVLDTCRTLGKQKHIVLIEGVFDENEWQQAITHDFGCVVHCQSQLDFALNNTPADDGFCRTIWLKYNTGMNRLGFDRDGVLHSAKLLHEKGYRLILTSHFACADDKNSPANAQQIERFNDVLDTLKSLYGDVQGSLCNSAGIINFPHVHHDWVRAGIALYGGKPVTHQSSDELNLRPVMTFSTQIFATHTLQAGEQVGYGGLWTADKPCRIGVLSVGYGDGYPRVVDNAKVLIIKENQTYVAPLIGRVAMDMMMIDLTNIPADVGDTVVLWGDGLPADDVADWANTISYELFCKITKRPTRRIVFE